MSPNHTDAELGALRLTDRARERAQLLLHIAAACPADAAEISRRIARPAHAIQDDLKDLMTEGIVHVFDGTLRTSAAARILSESSAQEIRDVHDQVLAEVASASTVRQSTLIALAESGCTDELLMRLLVRHAGAHPNDALILSTLAQLARTRQVSEAELLLIRAREAALRGLPEQVLSLTDPLLMHPSPSIARRAALSAAGAHIQGNRLARAAALYTHTREEPIGHDTAWAIVAALGQGDLAHARDWQASLGSANFTSQSAGLHELAEGLLLSVSESGDGALDVLARSIATLTPLGPDVVLPETPAALAAMLSIGRGEPHTAQVFLDRALKAELGGAAGMRRHELLMAWALMMQGHVTAAEKLAASLDPIDTLCMRDRFLAWSLQAGLARRRTDISAMRQAWHEIRGLTFGMDITLYDLLPLGEVMVVAARLRDGERVQSLVDGAQSILTQLGSPVAWSAPFHWHGVQAAFQAEDTAALLPHANALVQAAQISPYAATLAQAGHTWLEMLRGETDFASVEASARALASHGHVWDAARLAGQAALQHPEREHALSMMQLAREIDKDHARHAQSAPKSSPLTTRELEVAKLVLHGQGYRAIGEQLFISPKTVEHHVARIRSRLGATSRGDLLEKLHDELVKLE